MAADLSGSLQFSNGRDAVILEHRANSCLPLNKFYFPYERGYNHSWGVEWTRQRSSFCIVCCSVYLLLVFLLQRVMLNREALNLKYYLAFWNIVLSVFSVTGTIRTLPEYLHAFSKGWRYSICIYDSHHDCDNAFAFWSLLFVVSKLVELGDTLFLVGRKKPVSFLHWYHHSTVLLFSWFIYPLNVGTVRHFMVMNFAVHSLMYSYYALRTLRITLPKFVAPCITAIQILQMILGFTISSSALIIGESCQPSQAGLFGAFILYASYLVLFVRFFFKNYLTEAAPVQIVVEKKIE